MGCSRDDRDKHAIDEQERHLVSSNDHQTGNLVIHAEDSHTIKAASRDDRLPSQPADDDNMNPERTATGCMDVKMCHDLCECVLPSKWQVIVDEGTFFDWPI